MQRTRLLLLAPLLCAVTARVGSPEEFPSTGWLPKEETGALRFLKEHPKYDGRGVIVAIFDTGVDPGVDGLQTTSDGRPKIIDMVDGSGSGDVDTSEVRQAKDGSLQGLSGRTLRIPSDWNNPSGEYHVGWKRAFELFPRDLVRRVRQKRREQWDVRQRDAAHRLRATLVEFDRATPKPDDGQKRQRAEIEKRIQLLDSTQKTFDDPGPIFDCVVFHDGKMWQAAIDTDEDGELGDEQLMTNYRHRRQYAAFDEESLLHYAVNIYDQGNLLSIVSDCGSHGTHVAGIVAAHYPDHPERNGLAPGAQIVSVKIGDSRLGSSSTGTGEMRGMTAVLKNGCDLINMSYGGATADPNAGRRLARYAEIIHEKNVIFVASAGNNGPALSTVGSPGGTSSALLGVGAYVSPDLMRNAYAQLLQRDEQSFTWTSRGPTADGDLGVDVCAPGGAISPVAKWSLQHRRLANGTSMSSPNACGNLALLLSSLKQESITYTPTTIRRAIVNTARPLKNADPFAHGRGLLQIHKAYEYAKAFADSENNQVRFEVSFPDYHGNRGLYLRDAHQRRGPLTTSVQIQPRLPDVAGNLAKSSFDMAIQLKASADWIEAPSQCILTYAGKSFEIRVDSSELEAGAHYAEVLGFDARAPERGPLFRAPVTVIKPHVSEGDARNGYHDRLSLREGTEHRLFLEAPLGATWVDVTLQAHDGNEGPRRYALHALQPVPHRGYGRGYQREYVTLAPGQAIVRSFPVEASHTLEICLAQYWSSLGRGEVDLSAQFHGLTPSPREFVVPSQEEVARLEVVASLEDSWLEPSGELTFLRRTIPVSNFSMHPLSTDRDDLPDSRRMYASIAEYAFSLSEDREVAPRPAAARTPDFSATWESRLWQIFDKNKRLIASGGDSKTKLPKGDYVLRFHLRHEDPAELERWKTAALFLDITLPKKITMEFYGDPDEALAGRPKLPARFLRRGERAVLFVRQPKLPPFAAQGDLLVGAFQLGSDSRAVSGSGQRPNGFRLTCPIAASPVDAKKEKNDLPSSEAKEPFWLTARREQLGKLRTRKDREAFDQLVNEILEKHPHDLPTLWERLKLLDDEDRKQRLPEIVRAADAMLKQISQGKLAAALALRIDPEDKDAIAGRRRSEQQKEWLTDALYRKARAVAYMDLPPTPGAEAISIPKHPKKRAQRDKLFEKTYAQLRQWVDMTEQKYILVNIRRERRHGRHAAALELLEKALKNEPYRALLHKKRGDLFEELGWEHWRSYQDRWKVIRFPPAYPPF